MHNLLLAYTASIGKFKNHGSTCYLRLPLVNKWRTVRQIDKETNNNLAKALAYPMQESAPAEHSQTNYFKQHFFRALNPSGSFGITLAESVHYGQI